MKKVISSLVLSLLFVVPSVLLAETIEGTIALPGECTVIDKTGTPHSFPKDNSPSSFLAVCALAKALETGLITSMQLGEFPDFGLFVERLNGIVAGGDEFWALWKNGAFADCGIECLVLGNGDTVSFILTSFEGEERGSSIILHITAPAAMPETPQPTPTSGGGKYTPPPARAFDLSAALAYLSSKQRSDGSFSSSLLTDWVAIAFGAAREFGRVDVQEKMRTYLSSAPLEGSSATDLERRIMALEALGIDPYDTAYVDLLIERFDGTQMGEATLVNDDIFAIFPLSHAGYGADNLMMRAILDTIVGAQQRDGSWASSVDLTAAAIQALVPFRAHPGASSALERAESYLRGRQLGNGGFGSNSFSTSWVLQAIAALGQKPSDWNIFEITPLGHLGNMQQGDGGVEGTSASDETRIWATAYAIPAAPAKPWDAILKNFARKEKEPSATTHIEASVPMIITALSFSPAPTPAPTVAERASEAVPTAATPATPSAASGATTTSESTTSVQVAAVGESTGRPNDTWFWLIGLGAVLLGSYWYVMRAR